jgi:hypothetical protein
MEGDGPLKASLKMTDAESLLEDEFSFDEDSPAATKKASKGNPTKQGH